MIKQNLKEKEITEVKLTWIHCVDVAVAVCGCPVCIRHGLKTGKWPCALMVDRIPAINAWVL